ncbi:MAG: S41 family peptidase [Fimbriimonadaceae bacterium]|nr:S41 family peptidase [Alphaproteobacteria bacterium]
MAAGFAAGIAVTSPKLIPAEAASGNPETYRQLNLFGEVFERVRAGYVEQPDDVDLIDAAISGMLTSLDPHSSYMNPKSFRDMRVQTRGEFGGLGIQVTMENGLIKVISPIDDTPAARAGILPGDLITHLDNEAVMGLTLTQAVDKMRGPVNSPITLTVVREGADQPLEIEIVRDIVQIQSVRSAIEDGDVGYIRITTFNEQTFDGLKKAFEKLQTEIGAENVKGYILDLRNNPGGLLDQAIEVSDALLDRGAIVSTRGRDAEESQRYNARTGDLSQNKPIIVLINGGSASASEIVAGALRDHRRATLLGTRSFGKGSVQTIIPLGPNGAIRLTTARYYTPAGISIQAKGIEPDILVEQELPEELRGNSQVNRGESSLRGHLTTPSQTQDGEESDAEQSGSSAYVPTDRNEDKQLLLAIDLLRGVQQNEHFPPDPNTAVSAE